MVSLAAHEWPASGAGPDAPLAVLVHGVTGWWKTWWRVGPALAVQRAMAAHGWPDGREVKVRIGLHTGRPTLTATGYQGISVNTAARLCDCGHGGQTLASRATRAALAEEAAYELRLLGSYRLRGIPEDHEIYQLVVPDLPDGFPPLRIDETEGDRYRIPH